MTATELAWLEQGARVALAVAPTDEETCNRIFRYMIWRWGKAAVLQWAAARILHRMSSI